MYLFGQSAPEGAVESTWLGDQVERMRHAMQDYLAGNAHAVADDFGGGP